MKFTEEELNKIAEKANNVLGDNEAYITARIGKDGTFECNAAGTTATILRALVDTAAQLFINAENGENRAETHPEIIEMINDIPRMIKREMIKMQLEQIIRGLAASLDEPEVDE